ncbi:MAG: hypothetical protein ACRD2X_02835 [Vicinamibacteraceae bacterium]
MIIVSGERVNALTSRARDRHAACAAGFGLVAVHVELVLHILGTPPHLLYEHPVPLATAFLDIR